ncbi:Rap1 GTPase-activating protein 2, partial [Stegodyphus mimosarum]
MPSMIASHFLHTFIVVQVIDPLSANTRYKVSVTFRDDVPAFGPQLPSPPVFKKSEEFRTFFLTKLINAEIASLKAKKFVSLERRTRNSLLQALYDNLLERTLDFCGFSVPSDHNKSEIGTSSGFFDSVRKALSGRNRSHSVESNLAHAIPKRSSSRASNSSLTGTLTGDTTPSTVRAQSSQIIDSSSLQSSFNRDSPKDDTDPSFSGHLRFGKRTNSNPENFLPNSGTPPPLQPTMSESDSSSMNSLELERPIAPEDSDTGSNTEVLVQDILPAEVCEHEIAKLKIEKLNLLKEISVCQMEMKRLKANEIRLSTELSVMKQENKRLTEALLRLQVAHDTIV